MRKGLPTEAEMLARLRFLAETKLERSFKTQRPIMIHEFSSSKETTNAMRDHEKSRQNGSHDHVGRARISNGAWIYNQVNGHPLLQMAVKAWGMQESLVYRLVEEKGLDVVIRSLEFARTYTAARNKGAYATSLIRNGGPKRGQP